MLAATAEEMEPLQSHLILVVDDEQAIRDTLCQVLEDESFEAISAPDGPAALEMVRTHRPALVFLDIWLPGWDGIETLEQIKQLSPETEVIMISGHATIANALEATRRGAFDFIEKPLDIESILLSISRALERQTHKQLAEGGVLETAGGHKSLKGGGSGAVLSHPGMLGKGLAGRDVGQRTLRRGAIRYGQCLHSGQKSGLVLEPLPPNSGIHFAKMGNSRTIPAYVDQVKSTAFATTLRDGHAVVATIEHLLSALHAHKISNLLIKCNEEVPIFDGSSLEFCELIEQVGIEEQEGEWFEIAVDQVIEVAGESGEGQECIRIEPADTFAITYELDYPAPVGCQSYSFSLEDVESYREQIAPARTFGFLKDIEALQRAGLAAGGRLNNFILIGEDDIVNTDLRFPDELARHKILDIFGDLFLLGRPIRGHVYAKMTGHSDNICLLEAILAKL